MQPQDDTYLCLAAPALAEMKVKGSRFMGEAVPVSSEAEAMEALASIRKREYTATHHCWAYRVGIEAVLERFNDDGEPSGTAGQPILRQIKGRELTNTLVVVTRYYGGTKLGTGGLIRAYGDAAVAALDEGGLERNVIEVSLTVRFGYNDTSPAMHTISAFGGTIAASSYGDDTVLDVLIRQSKVAAFTAAFVDNLRGRGAVKQTGRSA